MAKPHGPHIQTARERKKLSRTELGTKVGKSYQWVYNLENEHKGTKPESLYLLAEVLNVPITYVMRTDQLQESA